MVNTEYVYSIFEHFLFTSQMRKQHNTTWQTPKRRKRKEKKQQFIRFDVVNL